MDKKSRAFYDRQFKLAVDCYELVNKLPKTSSNRIYSNQLIRSSSSIGANYIEAIESLSEKDFVHRLKVCRKESRESIHWLRLIKETNKRTEELGVKKLTNEAGQFVKMFSSAIITSEKKIK